jgi:hypothetical protein
MTSPVGAGPDRVGTVLRLAIGLILPSPLAALVWSILASASPSPEAFGSGVPGFIAVTLFAYPLALFPSLLFSIAMEFAVLPNCRSSMVSMTLGTALGALSGLWIGSVDAFFIGTGAFAGAATALVLVLVRPRPPPRDAAEDTRVTSSEVR